MSLSILYEYIKSEKTTLILNICRDILYHVSINKHKKLLVEAASILKYRCDVYILLDYAGYSNSDSKIIILMIEGNGIDEWLQIPSYSYILSKMGKVGIKYLLLDNPNLPISSNVSLITKGYIKSRIHNNNSIVDLIYNILSLTISSKNLYITNLYNHNWEVMAKWAARH